MPRPLRRALDSLRALSIPSGQTNTGLILDLLGGEGGGWGGVRKADVAEKGLFVMRPSIDAALDVDRFLSEAVIRGEFVADTARRETSQFVGGRGG
jgi:hypothetical protein